MNRWYPTMGTMSSRAVLLARSLLASLLIDASVLQDRFTTGYSRPRCVTVPPQQPSEHQVEVGGQIRLASGGGCRMSSHHEHATTREAGEASPRHFP